MANRGVHPGLPVTPRAVVAEYSRLARENQEVTLRTLTTYYTPMTYLIEKNCDPAVYTNGSAVWLNSSASEKWTSAPGDVGGWASRFLFCDRSLRSQGEEDEGVYPLTSTKIIDNSPAYS